MIKISKDEYIEKIKIKCDELDFTFNGFAEEFKGSSTKLLLICNRHEKPFLTKKNTINNFLNKGIRSCLECRSSLVSSKCKFKETEWLKIFESSLVNYEGFTFCFESDGYVNIDALSVLMMSLLKLNFALEYSSLM